MLNGVIRRLYMHRVPALLGKHKYTGKREVISKLYLWDGGMLLRQQPREE